MDFTRLEKYLNALNAAYDFRAFDLNVRQNGKKIYRYLYGCTDANETRPASRDDLQWLYSMSKVITCVGALRLVERGLLGLDDPVYKYLPEYRDITVKRGDNIEKAKNTMLVRHLFAMRSGLDYKLMTPALKKARENKNASTREIVKAIAEDPLLFEPGESYQYSLSHDVLAAIVEVVSGKSFYEYLKDEIFDPLGMKDVGFHPTEEQKARFCAQYTFDPYTYKTKLNDGTCAYRLSEKYESGGAGVFASNDTYMLFAQTMANYGTAYNGYELLKRQTVDLMRQDQQPKCDQRFLRPGYSYALGVRVLVDKCEPKGESLSPLGEFGWAGAASSYTVMDTDNNLAIVFTANVLNCTKAGDEMHPHIRNLVYDAMGIKA